MPGDRKSDRLGRGREEAESGARKTTSGQAGGTGTGAQALIGGNLRHRRGSNLSSNPGPASRVLAASGGTGGESSGRSVEVCPLPYRDQCQSSGSRRRSRNPDRDSVLVRGGNHRRPTRLD